MKSDRPPYVYPDRKPDKYDMDRHGHVWVVLSPMYKDGTGWNWGVTLGNELEPGDIWVPIHLLHSREIPAVVARSEELKSLTSESSKG